MRFTVQSGSYVKKGIVAVDFTQAATIFTRMLLADNNVENLMLGEVITVTVEVTECFIETNKILKQVTTGSVLKLEGIHEA